MSPEITVLNSAWGVMLALSVALGYKYREKVAKELQSNADLIERYNTMNGYGFVVEPKSLAKDMINPVSNSSLRKIDRSNEEICLVEYKQALRNRISYSCVAASLVHSGVVLYAFLGTWFLFIRSDLFSTYVMSSYVLLCISLVLYFVA